MSLVPELNPPKSCEDCFTRVEETGMGLQCHALDLVGGFNEVINIADALSAAQTPAADLVLAKMTGAAIVEDVSTFGRNPGTTGFAKALMNDMSSCAGPFLTKDGDTTYQSSRYNGTEGLVDESTSLTYSGFPKASNSDFIDATKLLPESPVEGYYIELKPIRISLDSITDYTHRIKRVKAAVV